MQLNDVFKLQVTNRQSSAGWRYELDIDESIHALSFEREYTYGGQSDGGMTVLGASGLDVYTVTVDAIGSGNIRLVPMSVREPGTPETMYDPIVIPFESQ